MVGEVRIVKAEFLQENNISMAKDSTNPLNIEWFSYENYDLDYAWLDVVTALRVHKNVLTFVSFYPS